jgi:hypothetical protein
MEDKKREDQIEKIQSLINKKAVSRRDFFGTIGKITILSQVVALGAFNFLSSCVAFEDKQGSYGSLKTFFCNDPNLFTCTQGYICDGFICDADQFTCEPASPNQSFACDPNLNFSCDNNFDCITASGPFASHSGGNGG